MQQVRLGGNAQADAERGGDDQHAAPVQWRLRKDAHPGSGHAAEHHQVAPPNTGLGICCSTAPINGNKPRQNSSTPMYKPM